MLLKRKFLGVPFLCVLFIFSLCLLGIAVGSPLDYQISSSFANPSCRFFEYLSPALFTWLFVAAGVLFFKAFKDNRKIGAFALVLTIIYASNYLSSWLIKQFAYQGISDQALLNSLGYLTAILISCSEAFILFPLMKKDYDKSYLIRLATLIIVSIIFSEIIGSLFKGMASRPRYRDIMAPGSTLSYSSWWQFHFWNGSGDATRSFPSGHMIMVSSLFMLPLFAPLWKWEFKGNDIVSFVLATIVVVLVGISRIYNGAHFLSDVCFGVLVEFGTCCICYRFLFDYKKESEPIKKQ